MKLTTKLIYFIRHGETKLNALGIRQSSEGGLTEKGRAQALDTAKRFPKKKGSPQVIIASPYERTKETASIIADELKMNVEYCPLLVERRNPTEIIGHKGVEKDTKQIVDLIDKSFHDDNFRYSDEENFSDLKERARLLLEYIKTRPEQRIMMVTHSIFLKMVVSYMLLGEELTASKYNTLSYLNPIDNGGITICSYARADYWFIKSREEWKLIIWNDLIENDDPKEGY
jgi:broad specificity phosphatase PhoE